MNFSVPIASALIGVVVLLFGRRLFWLCVAAVGFAAGVELAPHLVTNPTPLVALIVAVVLGLIGALLAIFLQKIAIAVAGFLAGGKLATAIAAAFFIEHAHYFTITFVIGGILGALLLLMLFDWALIFFSAMVGAHLIARTIVLPPSGATILFIALVALGIVVQVAMLRRSRIVA
jgi:MFS family permease